MNLVSTQVPRLFQYHKLPVKPRWPRVFASNLLVPTHSNRAARVNGGENPNEITREGLGLFIALFVTRQGLGLFITFVLGTTGFDFITFVL